MKIVGAVLRAVAFVGMTAIISLSGAATVFASPNAGPVAAFGSVLRFDPGNGVIIDYTVSDFRPSTDVVDYPRFGHLWEATLTVDAVQGTATPVLPFFNARVTTGRQAGRQYRILFQAYAPAAISPDSIGQGGKRTGKVYFDCNGSAPSSVVYHDGAQDLLTWQ